MSGKDIVVSIDPRALEMIRGVREREPDAEELGLVIGISGIDGAAFTYEMALMRLEDAPPEDHIDVHDGFPIIVASEDVEKLRGASITMSRNMLQPGLAIENPNSPSPRIAPDAVMAELTGPVAERVAEVVSTLINPAIASHGGFVEVVAIEDATAYVRLGGGCQGCGMAPVTLSQGIETTITQKVPEILKVVDVTDHESGENPYYEQSKK